jgi:hypothetical protein
MPDLDVFDDDGVPDHLMWQVVATMRELWPGVFTGDRVWMTRSYPAGVRSSHVVVHHERVLVAYAALIRLTIPYDGRDLAVDGLGSVITAGPYRRQGHGARVQNRVARLLESGDADVAALFCAPENAPFYARTGWVACPGGTLVGPSAAALSDVGLRMMRFLSDRGRAARATLVDQPWRVDWTW